MIRPFVLFTDAEKAIAAANHIPLTLARQRVCRGKSRTSAITEPVSTLHHKRAMAGVDKLRGADKAKLTEMFGLKL